MTALNESLPASHLDLLQTPGTAIFSTVTPSGAVQSTAVWYLLDDDGELKLSLSTARKKFRNLQTNPNATLFILDPTNPFRFVEVRATATVDADPAYAFRNKVGAHYGADVASFDAPDTVRVVVTLHPQRVNAQ
jgi:PPOX class probable F420-dependent enzyme